MKRFGTILLAAISVGGICRAAEPSGPPTVQRMMPTTAPVITELPNSLHERNAQMLAEKRQLQVDFASAASEADQAVKVALPSIAALRDPAQIGRAHV